jgi:cob(I)alamin adenosyltransferase
MARSRDEPVRLTRIYTRAGDGGQTSLGDGSRVPKTHPRVVAYGTVDELNSWIGLALAGDLPARLRTVLERVQNELFDVGADLSVPPGADRRGRLRVAQSQIEALEHACDELNAELEPLKSFVLPGGSEAAARLQLARAVCRRAEIAALRVDDASPETLAYLNRLSDLLFIASRSANAESGVPEPLWKPGATHS